MRARAHGEWRLLRALISHAAGSRFKGHALPKQIDAAGQQLLPRNATALVLLGRSRRYNDSYDVGGLAAPRADHPYGPNRRSPCAVDWDFTHWGLRERTRTTKWPA